MARVCKIFAQQGEEMSEAEREELTDAIKKILEQRYIDPKSGVYFKVKDDPSETKRGT